MSLLKSTPWMSVGRSALLAVVAWAILSALLQMASQVIPALATVRSVLLGPPLSLLTNAIIGAGIGSLAMILLEKSGRILSISTMWLLVLAVTLGLLIYDYFPIGIYRLLGIKFNQLILVGIVIGVFRVGRKHWR